MLIHSILSLQHSSAQIDHLAHCVIQVFEDSCGDEWLGQTIESSDDEAADGAHRYVYVCQQCFSLVLGPDHIA